MLAPRNKAVAPPIDTEKEDNKLYNKYLKTLQDIGRHTQSVSC